MRIYSALQTLNIALQLVLSELTFSARLHGIFSKSKVTENKFRKYFSLPIAPLTNIPPSLLHPAILFHANSTAIPVSTIPTPSQTIINFSAENTATAAKLFHSTYGASSITGPNA